jgi:hypothetical protein
MKIMKAFGSAILALSVVGSSYAHHASVGIDRSKTITVEGVITQFRWANPHSWIEMEVVNSAGKTELWNFEMLPPSYLIPAGWTRSTIKTGDRVKVSANGFLDGMPGGIFVSVTLPDGKTLGQRGGGGARGAGAAGGAGGAGDARGGRGQ